MLQEVMDGLYEFREEAIRILGLPAHMPLTHADVEQAYHVKSRTVHDTAACEALLLVQMLAHTYVHARGWYRQPSPRHGDSLLPALVEDTAQLAPLA